MYDLTVEKVHTFAVGDGDWVVHNVNCDFWLADASSFDTSPARGPNDFPTDPSGREGGAIATYNPDTGELLQIAMYDYTSKLQYIVEYDAGQGWHAHYSPDGTIQVAHTPENHINDGGGYGTVADLQSFLNEANFSGVNWGPITFPPTRG